MAEKILYPRPLWIAMVRLHRGGRPIGGHGEVVNMSVERSGIEADSKDSNGRVQLSYAAWGRHLTVVARSYGGTTLRRQCRIGKACQWTCNGYQGTPSGTVFSFLQCTLVRCTDSIVVSFTTLIYLTQIHARFCSSQPLVSTINSNNKVRIF